VSKTWAEVRADHKSTDVMIKVLAFTVCPLLYANLR
jgi:hypothetical protein